MPQKLTPRIDERWIRHDWRMWIRPDIARWMKPGVDPADVIPALARERAQREAKRAREEAARAAEDAAFAAQIEHERRALAALNEEVKELNADMARWRRRVAEEEAKYSPIQPRVPAGNSRGGQWTDRGGGLTSNRSGNANATQASRNENGSTASKPQGINDPRVISDADPENIKPGEQYAQAGRRGGGTILINGQRLEINPRQAAELEAVIARADSAIARLQEIEPSWKPRPSAYESVNGLIEKYRADAQQAQDRASELGKIGFGRGPFVGGSSAARGPERDFTAAERREINRFGYETGCHTCGTRDPGTKTGNFVIDHQPPSALNWSRAPQRLYPQCWSCSLKQGGFVNSFKGK